MEEEYEQEQEQSEELPGTPETEEETEPEAGETEQEEQSETEEPASNAPVIPRKAYESEKSKRQAAQQENEQLKAKIAEYEASKTAPAEPKTIEELYDISPQAALSHIDQQIQAAQAEYDDTKVQQLRDYKVTMVAQGMARAQQRTNAEAQIAKMEAEIYKNVPDFATKKPEFIKMATESGLSEKYAMQMLDPSVVGDAAIETAKMFNTLYSKLNAGKTAKQKEVKQTPNKTESAGTGGFKNNNQTQVAFERAKQSGKLDDWASLLG